MKFNAISAQIKRGKVRKNHFVPVLQRSAKQSGQFEFHGLASMIGNQAMSRLIQAKLTVGAPNDKYEQEAEHVADQIMRMPEHHLQRQVGETQEDEEELAQEAVQAKPLGSAITPLVQRQAEFDDDREEKTIQAKSTLNSSVSVDSDVQRQIQSLKGAGQPLAPLERAYFEPRFGRDFGDVRIHTDSVAQQSAKSINARAYTLGADVVFGVGEYATGTNASRHLLAHELTHVVQQGHGQSKASSKTNVNTRVQRRVKVNPGVSLNMYGYTHTKTSDIYTAPRVEKSSIYHEIFTSLLHSPRIFKIKGSTNMEANKNFRLHRATRQRVLNFAAKKKYTFGAGPAFRMNPTYWNVTSTSYGLKPGADRKKAVKDLNIHPDKYKIACTAATRLTMEGGGATNLRVHSSSDRKDWIPADWGYITNTGFTGAASDVGLEGENIIYTGKGKYWGHFGAGNTYKTLKQWFDTVKAWHGGANIENTRKSPNNGLE